MNTPLSTRELILEAHSRSSQLAEAIEDAKRTDNWKLALDLDSQVQSIMRDLAHRAVEHADGGQAFFALLSLVSLDTELTPVAKELQDNLSRSASF